MNVCNLGGRSGPKRGGRLLLPDRNVAPKQQFQKQRIVRESYEIMERITTLWNSLSMMLTERNSQGMEVVAFERSMTFKSKGGNHLQFNVLSIPAAAAKDARQVYHSVAERHGIKLKEVPGATKVRLDSPPPYDYQARGTRSYQGASRTPPPPISPAPTLGASSVFGPEGNRGLGGVLLLQKAFFCLGRGGGSWETFLVAAQDLQSCGHEGILQPKRALF